MKITALQDPQGPLHLGVPDWGGTQRIAVTEYLAISDCGLLVTPRGALICFHDSWACGLWVGWLCTPGWEQQFSPESLSGFSDPSPNTTTLSLLPLCTKPFHPAQHRGLGASPHKHRVRVQERQGWPPGQNFRDSKAPAQAEVPERVLQGTGTAGTKLGRTKPATPEDRCWEQWGMVAWGSWPGKPLARPGAHPLRLVWELNQGSRFPALSRLSRPSQLLLTSQPRA